MIRRTLFAAGILAAAAGTVTAQDFDWRGTLDRGQTLEIRGVNGDIDVMPGSDDGIRVLADRHGRRSDPESVRFEGYTVNGEVDVDGAEADVRVETVNGDVEVRTTGFAEASTVNGDITCFLGTSSLPADVEFETVNGSIRVEMPEGLNADLHASTVNGSIESDFPILVTGRVTRRTLRGEIGAGGPELRVSTVNGSIQLRRR